MKGKRILLGITGGIAAYKSAYLIRTLVKLGAEVQVVASASAFDFIAPLTLSTLSGNEVLHTFQDENGNWNNHVKLALWADVMIVAPCTANTLAAFASGHCNNLLQACYLSARSKVFVAPAMDLDMYQHPAVRKNLETLRVQGVQIIPSESGFLASGLEGEGRMAEPETIAASLSDFFNLQQRLKGKRFLVTAGPTYEAIDPVRFIGNHSSGKMGLAIAEALTAQGAVVDLVCGPGVNAGAKNLMNVHKVSSALEMLDCCIKLQPESHAVIMAAAIADYRPENVAAQKIKKSDDELNIRLVKNPDVISELVKQKPDGQIIVGFALETENEKTNALQKLKKKGMDAIVLNSLNDEGAGFGTDTNKVSIIFSDTDSIETDLISKKEAAAVLVETLINRYFC
jgi:phosphopantothenoylcysteine decarboxylase / phosphopantothenate---cysteine ligase